MQTSPISIHLDNLTSRDAQFLQGVIKFFCDPIYEDLAAQIRAGAVVIHYGPKTGLACTMPASNWKPPSGVLYHPPTQSITAN